MIEKFDDRLAEAIREGKPPMLRCWVNEHSGAKRSAQEIHVIIEGIDGSLDWNIVPEEKVILLGESEKGDALGSFRDAYVRVIVLTLLSGDDFYFVHLDGCDSMRIKVCKDNVVFARPSDTETWNEIRDKLKQRTQIKANKFHDNSGKLAIDMRTGSFVEIE